MNERVVTEEAAIFITIRETELYCSIREVELVFYTEQVD